MNCANCGKETTKQYCSVRCMVQARHPKKKADPLAVHRKYSHSKKGRETRQEVTARRRQKERQVVSTLTPEEWNRTLDFFHRSCAYCGEKKSLQRDHFIPVSAGGESTRKNYVPACRKCNTGKKDLDPLEWLLSQEHGLVIYTKVMQYLETV